MIRKLILTVLIVLPTTGCNLIDGAEFYPSDYFIGVELCKNNDGLRGVYVSQPAATRLSISCNNTASFYSIKRYQNDT